MAFFGAWRETETHERIQKQNSGLQTLLAKDAINADDLARVKGHLSYAYSVDKKEDL